MTAAPPLRRLAPGAHGDCLWVEPVYHLRGYEGAIPEVRLRPEVAEALIRAAEGLRAEHATGLLVWDGWRPPALQRRLWDEYRQDLARTTGLEGEALDARARLFVSPPDGDDGSPPPHSTGRTVDLTLCSPDGAALDMGGEFDELTERSAGDYYEREGLAPAEQAYRDRRRLLLRAMEEQGFHRLPSEWWHFEHGQD
ncbi:MAG TPA: M15 family metallopeptidase [Solirubrobacterales bacterium]|nr:M15 family metallopeptidase [Solirubrobacterales bacterium]